MSGADQTIAARTKSLLGMQLWLVHFDKPESLDALSPHLEGHFEYALGLERDGRLFAAGPIRNAAGELEGQGLFILRAATRDEAMALAMADPIAAAGVRKVRVEHWTVNLGTLDLRLRYSDQRLAITG